MKESKPRQSREGDMKFPVICDELAVRRKIKKYQDTANAALKGGEKIKKQYLQILEYISTALDFELRHIELDIKRTKRSRGTAVTASQLTRYPAYHQPTQRLIGWIDVLQECALLF